MNLSVNGTWFASRSLKSDTITPEIVRQEPKKVLGRLLNGHLYLFDSPTTFNDRGWYGSERGNSQKGKFSYKVIFAVAKELRKGKPNITIFSHYSVEPMSILQCEEIGIYNKMLIPDERLEEVLPYVIIHGGETKPGDETKMLDELYIGEKARQIMDELYNKEGRNWRDDFYRRVGESVEDFWKRAGGGESE